MADASASYDDAEPKRTVLHRIFVVPDGERTQSMMAHISSLSPGERPWFEQGVLAGDTVVMPHEALCDTPVFLALRRPAAAVSLHGARGGRVRRTVPVRVSPVSDGGAVTYGDGMRRM